MQSQGARKSITRLMDQYVLACEFRDLLVFILGMGPKIRQRIERKNSWSSLQNSNKILLSQTGIEPRSPCTRW